MSKPKLYLCDCHTFYDAHHPECPARRQWEAAEAKLEKLRQTASELYTENCWHCADGICSKCNAFRKELEGYDEQT